MNLPESYSSLKIVNFVSEKFSSFMPYLWMPSSFLCFMVRPISLQRATTAAGGTKFHIPMESAHTAQSQTLRKYRSVNEFLWIWIGFRLHRLCHTGTDTDSHVAILRVFCRLIEFNGINVDLSPWHFLLKYGLVIIVCVAVVDVKWLYFFSLHLIGFYER